jgi:hypothetical protein
MIYFYLGSLRRPIEASIYVAASKNVCQQVMVDTSCYSKCSTLHGANLNQLALSTCEDQIGNNPCYRAGYDNDVWIGASSMASGEFGPAWSDGTEETRRQVIAAMKSAADEGHPADIAGKLQGDTFASTYLDDGYGLHCPR